MKKGFTLIELLAVIVVLAIIALIATPIVMNTINEVQKSAAKRSVDRYKNAVEIAVTSYKLSFPEDNNIKPYKLYKEYNGKKDFIEYKGGDIDCDIQIYSTEEVYITNCTIDGKEVLADDSTEENKKYYSVGKETIESHIGENVNYVATGTSYKGPWRILGVENGKVLLLSDSIGTLTLQGKEGYNTAITQLDTMASAYAGGIKAVNARSVRAADINKITGYNPYKTGDGQIFRKGQTSEYGNVVTYSYKDGIIAYKGSNGVEGADENYTSYEDLDGTLISSEYPTKTVQHTSTYYYYLFTTLTAKETSNAVGLKQDSLAYKMLYKQIYWLADQDICASPSRTSWQIRTARGNKIDAKTLYHSFDAEDAQTAHSAGVRVVVTLDESAKLVYDNENSIWNIE